ncbi:hypothetical protein QFC24_002831 [Naganishia onofrii]|uniref:Uncharacterized protein n=1 Tax=Naganishia onofrii TaxID=1851511 RepID=A0ACC2XNR9_9TREE|nr:hypothetical protein QFC24_002831 [Naganishia onofrii]
MTPDPCRPPAHEPTNPNASDHDHEPVDPNAINDEQPSRHQEPESHDSQWKRQDTSFIARSLLKHGKGSRSPSPVNWDELLSRHVVSSQSNAESVLSPAVTVHPASKQELDGPVSSAPSSSRPRSTPPVQRSARRRIRTPSPRPSSDGELVMELFDSGTNSDSDAVASPVSRLFRRRIRTPLPPPSSDSALELSDSDADADCDFDFGSVCSSEKDVMMPVPLTHATTTPAAVASPRTTGTNGREAAAGDRPATYPSAVQTAPPSQLLISFESDPITERDSGRLSSPTHTVDERPIQPTVASAADASVRKSPPFQKKWKPTHPSSTKMSSVIDNSSPTRLAPIGLKEEKVSKGPNVIQSTIAAEARPLPWEITDEQHDTLLASVTDEYPFGTPEARAPHEAAMSAARSNGVEWVIPLIPTLSSRGLDYGAVTFSSQPYRPKVCHGEAIVKPHDGPMYDSCTHAIDESDSQYGFKCDSLAEYYAMYQWSDDEDERDV